MVLSSTQVNLYEAKTQLSSLVERAAKGEEFVIAMAGKPMAQLSAVTAEDRIAEPLPWGQTLLGLSKLPESFYAGVPDRLTKRILNDVGKIAMTGLLCAGMAYSQANTQQPQTAYTEYMDQQQQQREAQEAISYCVPGNVGGTRFVMQLELKTPTIMEHIKYEPSIYSYYSNKTMGYAWLLNGVTKDTFYTAGAIVGLKDVTLVITRQPQETQPQETQPQQKPTRHPYHPDRIVSLDQLAPYSLLTDMGYTRIPEKSYTGNDGEKTIIETIPRTPGTIRVREVITGGFVTILVETSEGQSITLKEATAESTFTEMPGHRLPPARSRYGQERPLGPTIKGPSYNDEELTINLQPRTE
jgi:hypothetical protein